MATRRAGRGAPEIWGLAVLFAVFLVAVTYYQQIAQETTSRDAPSSLNAQGPGVKAFYLLLEREGYRVDRLETGWSALDRQEGLLVAAEPFDPDRGIQPAEMRALRRWVQQGGSVLYFVSAPPRPPDPNDIVFGEVGVTAGSPALEQVAPAVKTAATGDVTAISVRSPVRLSAPPQSGYTTLFADSAGALALTKPLGKGRLFLVADPMAFSNDSIQKADNAVFLVNIAAETAGRAGKTVVFDEYHHGIGFDQASGSDEGGIWASAPLPLRLALLHLLALGALIVYNGNRRFGQPHYVALPAYRPSTDYLDSMARLFRRAGAADIALQMLYTRFARDLARHLDLQPETPLPQLAAAAERRYGPDDGALERLMARCIAVVAGQRVGEPEMLRLVQEIEAMRRRFHLVGDQ
ncbi:MAG TPA: DUF4350 domain-containing protein [Chthonomonadaceae bacterium]|nr:DUF4350 domain-containing protein [Chthonomonadaceae bacterium]